MRIFLTGASGFIGSHVMGQLIERGDEVVVLARGGRNAPHLRDNTSPLLQVVTGDLLAPEFYREALSTCDAVIHVAGWISTRKRDESALRSANLTATERLWETCQGMGMKRIVYLGSIFAHGRGQGSVPCNEDQAFDPGILALGVSYFRAKHQAELSTWRYQQDVGLPIIFGYPGFCIGPGDTYLSSMRIVRDFMRGRVPAYVPGGMGFIDVRDAAAGLVGCLDRGEVGEKYLLSNHNLTWRAFFDALSEVTNRRAPVAVPKVAASLLARLAERISLDGLISRGDVEVMGGIWFYNGKRARTELGMPSRALEQSLRDGVRWLREQGMID